MYQTAAFSFEEKRKWLRLIRAERVGPKRFFSWLKTFYSVDRIFEEITSGKLANHKIKLPAWSIIDQEIEQHQRYGARIIAYPEPDYPALLKEIHDPPPLLSMMGNIELLHRTSLAIVGARNASYMGQKWTRQTAQELGQLGYSIISGLARGIDAAAHFATLHTGTIAVIGSGLSHIYPPEHLSLFEEIREKGLILSENPFNAAPQARLFPRRNRIIAGISNGVLLIEAALQSGSLITAKYAIDYNRELFVVPGSPMDSRYRGSNMLLKNGAHLVQNAQDIIDALNIEYGLSESKRMDKKNHFLYETLDENKFNKEAEKNNLTEATSESQTADQEALLESLSEVPILVDELSQHLKINIAELQLMLSELELDGKIIRHAGNHVSLKG